jgi:hypothetical protein
MSNRAERRAAERANQPASVNHPQPQPTFIPLVMTASAGGNDSSRSNTSNPHTPNVDFEPSSSSSERPISDAKLHANRENAQHSTGPRTEEGKAKSSLNAVKTGLTGRTILLPSDDVDAYQQLIARTFTDLSPLTDKEKAVVQIIADTEWRLLRIAPLEASIWAMGFKKLGDLYPEETDQANRTSLIQAEIFAFFRRDFSNIALQERRLRNQRIADLAELKALQQERLDKAQEALSQRRDQVFRATDMLARAKNRNLEFNYGDFGFDFSIEELAVYNERNFKYGLLTSRTLDFDKFLESYRKEQKAA